MPYGQLPFDGFVTQHRKENGQEGAAVRFAARGANGGTGRKVLLTRPLDKSPESLYSKAERGMQRIRPKTAAYGSPAAISGSMNRIARLPAIVKRSTFTMIIRNCTFRIIRRCSNLSEFKRHFLKKIDHLHPVIEKMVVEPYWKENGAFVGWCRFSTERLLTEKESNGFSWI